MVCSENETLIRPLLSHYKVEGCRFSEASSHIVLLLVRGYGILCTFACPVHAMSCLGFQGSINFFGALSFYSGMDLKSASYFDVALPSIFRDSKGLQQCG